MANRATSYCLRSARRSTLEWGRPSPKRACVMGGYSNRSRFRNDDDDSESDNGDVGVGDILKVLVGGESSKRAMNPFAGHDHEESITRHRNHVYFWDQVTPANALKFSRLVREADEEQQVKLVKEELTDPVVYIHLNTPGGHLHEGFSMASVVEACRSRTVAIVEGMVASAGTLPLVCADERHMQKYSSVLIHQLRGGMWGTYEDNEDEIKNMRQAMATLRKIYKEHTTMPSKEIDKILKRELELNGKTCLKYGIVHKLI